MSTGTGSASSGSATAARAEVLARIRGALDGTEATSESAPDAEVPRSYLGADDEWETGMTGAALLALLTERIVDYRATVTTSTPGDVAATVARLLADATSVVVPADLDPAWLTELRPGGPTVLPDDPGAPLPIEDLDGADAVVTASRLAIAETGTIVLDAGPGQGRRAISLVPDHHICLVRSGDVVRGLPAAVARLDLTRPLTWISGPSATSDIELSRVEGVHGPRRLDVVLVD